MKTNRTTRTPSSFDQRCYAVLRQIPRGKVTTYKLIARAIGSRGARAVGGAMNRNPYAPKVPCHRVVKSDGSIGGYANGPTCKLKMLLKEGVRISGTRVNLDESLFVPRRITQSIKRRNARR